MFIFIQAPVEKVLLKLPVEMFCLDEVQLAVLGKPAKKM